MCVLRTKVVDFVSTTNHIMYYKGRSLKWGGGPKLSGKETDFNVTSRLIKI